MLLNFISGVAHHCSAELHYRSNIIAQFDVGEIIEVNAFTVYLVLFLTVNGIFSSERHKTKSSSQINPIDCRRKMATCMLSHVNVN